MNENHGGVTVPSVTEPTTSVEGAADETLIGNFGGGEGEGQGQGQVREGAFVGGEIMVEVVGLDVFVDGVGGEEGGLEREVGTGGGGEDGGSRDLKLEEVVDHSSQVWDALDNGDGDVEEGEVVVVVGEEGLDVGEGLSRDGKDVVFDVEAENLGTEMGIGVADVSSGPASGEAQKVAEEVAVTESVGVMDRGLVEEGERGTGSGDGEANLQDYVSSGQDVVFNDEAWRPAVAAGVSCSSKMVESLTTTHTQLVSEESVVVTREEVLISKYEVRETVAVNDKLAPPEVDQGSTVDMICEASDKGAMNTNADNLNSSAQVVEGEIDVMNKQGGLRSKHEVNETDPVAGQLSSVVESQAPNLKTSGESSESHRIKGVSSPGTMEPLAGGEVVQANDSKSSNSIDEAPNNVSLSLVGEGVGEVNTSCADKGSFGEGGIVTSVPSVAIDTEISVSVSPSHHADADEPLEIENNEVGCSVGNTDNGEDQELKDGVDESSKVDVAVSCVPIPSDDQTQYATASEVTTTERKVLNPIVEVHTTSDIGSLKYEKETSDNAAKHGAVPADPESTLEEACADGGDDAGMDIDEVMNWKDDVPENNVFSGTLSDLEEDEHLKLRKVIGTSEIEVAQADLKSSDGLIHTADGTDVALIELENTKFDVQEETNGNDVEYEPMELDSNSNSVIMQEEKQEIVLERDGQHIHEVYHGQSTDSPNTDEILNKGPSVAVYPERVAGDDGKSQSALTATSVHSEGNTAYSCINDLAAPLPDGIGSLENGQGVDDNEIISLQVETTCIKDDGDNTENTVKLQVSESQDGTEGGNSTYIGAISGQVVEVEVGYPDGFQEPETQLQTTEAETLISIDEEGPELNDPVASTLVHQSLYLQPPESEGDFSVSDLVWGKVRSHPWWPGQIFDPADASEKALKHHKKDSFLVAYFGDRTFAWNDASVLKPFRTHFSQVQKHNNSEAFRHAVSCALEEVSRRVELGLACSCIPQDDYDKIKSQVVENTGIKPESSNRYGVDKSAAVSSFEPDKLLDFVKALALSPYDGTDQLELVLAKAQLSSFSRYKGYPQLPEFQYSGELLESDDTSELIEAIEYPASACKEDEEALINSSSLKRKRSMLDTVYPNKKEKNLSDLMVDTPSSTDGEDGLDGKGMGMSVSTAGKKRRASESIPDGSDKSKSSHATKVSAATSPTPKPSFKIGECIRRAASQLTGSPSILKCSSEKFLKIDGDDDQPTGFESVQTPGTSPRGRMTDQSSVYEMLSQLHLAAQDPMKGYSFLSTIIPFFSSYRTSVVSKARRQNSSTGRSGTSRKRKASNNVSNTPEEFEFDDVNDSYWTDRIIQNYSEEQLLQDGQNGGVEYQPVLLGPKKQVKSVRKTNSRKRYSSSKYEAQAEEPVEHVDRRKLDLPTELVLNFAVGVSVPPEMNLNKTFRRFGPLMESETEVDRQGSRARVVFKKCSDAEVAYSSAGKFSLFGSKLVNYELNYSPLISYKPLPLPTLQAAEGAT